MFLKQVNVTRNCEMGSNVSIPNISFSSRKIKHLILQSNLSQAKIQTSKSQMYNLMILPTFRHQSKYQCVRF